MKKISAELDQVELDHSLLPPPVPVRNMIESPAIWINTEDRDILEKRTQAKRDANGRWRKAHPTVTTSRGIPVDRNIYELVEALWKIGFDTQFSCQGDVELFDESGFLDNTVDSAHIIFSKIEEAVIFMERSYKLLIQSRQDLQWTQLMKLEMMLPTVEIQRIRAIVLINPSSLDTLTEYWKSSL